MLSSIDDTIARFGLRQKKTLGQHFLTDSMLLERIVGLAGDLNNKTVIEIGPGPGGLTRAILAAGAADVYAIEKDRRCIAALEELKTVSEGRLHILEEDALRIQANELGQTPRLIIANLPYNIGTELLLGWFNDIYRDPGSYHSLLLMFQMEVGERITATPTTPHYGRISILADWLCERALLLPVPASAFSPPPKVESVVLQLVPRPEPKYSADKETLERVVATAFSQRRKMLRSSLKPLGPDLLSYLEKKGWAEKRAEELGTEQFCELAAQL